MARDDAWSVQWEAASGRHVDDDVHVIGYEGGIGLEVYRDGVCVGAWTLDWFDLHELVMDREARFDQLREQRDGT